MSKYMHFSNTYFLQNRTHYLDPGLRLRYISHNVKHFPRDCCHLREFVKLPSSWPWRVGRGPPTSGSWLHFAGDPRMPGRSPETAGDHQMNSKSRILYVFLQQKLLGPHSGAMFCYTFSYPSHLKNLFLRAFLEDGLPEMPSTLGVLAERDRKQKHHAIAPIAKNTW